MKKFTLKKQLSVAAAVLAFSATLSAQAFTENFDDITLLAGNGWSLQNLSSPVGSTNWFQGTSVAAGGPFDSYNGAANAYIGANYNNTGNTGTISNWLMTPNRTIRNGDVLTFYSRKVAPDSYADRLEVRLSTNGASTNAGATATTVGDFTTLLLSINPNLVLGVYPTVWTQYTITVSGLSAPMSGRFAFRYFVTSAGLNGTNSDYIGIDNVVYTPYVCPGLTVTPSTIPNGTAGVAYNQSLGQTGALGTPSYSITTGILPTGMSLSSGGVLSGTPTNIGAFNFTVTVSDASGCTGSQAYTIIISCPNFVMGGSTPGGTAGVPYSGSVTQSGGVGTTTFAITSGSLPTGLSMTSGGVISGTPTVTGTYTFTVTVTDQNNCTGSSVYTIIISCPNFVMGGSTPGGTAGVSYSGTITESGGVGTTTFAVTAGTLPTGLTMSGGGIISGTPTATGTFTFTVTVTDANSCTGSSVYTIVISCPTGGASFASVPALCSNSAMYTLTEGSPAGGTYSGTGVSGNQFDPSAGTQTVSYDIVDTYGCTQTATTTITVNTAPTVTAQIDTILCSTQPTYALTEGLPAGGTWSGSNVSGNSFDPMAAGVGSYTLTYTYTDANGCTDMASDTMVVDICLGLDANAEVAGLNVYPNPNNGSFTLTFTPQNQGTVLVDIFTAEGKLIATDKQENTAAYQHNFNLQNSGNGIYLVRITSADGVVYKKVVLQ